MDEWQISKQHLCVKSRDSEHVGKSLSFLQKEKLQAVASSSVSIVTSVWHSLRICSFTGDNENDNGNDRSWNSGPPVCHSVELCRAIFQHYICLFLPLIKYNFLFSCFKVLIQILTWYNFTKSLTALILTHALLYRFVIVIGLYSQNIVTFLKYQLFRTFSLK